MKHANQTSIDTIMDELQNKLIDDINKEKHNPRDDRYIGVDWRSPVINITVNPVINTTSEVKDTTKHSPLRELGNVLSPFLGFIKQ